MDESRLQPRSQNITKQFCHFYWLDNSYPYQPFLYIVFGDLIISIYSYILNNLYHPLDNDVKIKIGDILLFVCYYLLILYHYCI